MEEFGNRPGVTIEFCNVAKCEKTFVCPTFTFVTRGVESGVAQAKAAACDKAVQVDGGVSVARKLLDAGRADELHVDIKRVFLGQRSPVV